MSNHGILLFLGAGSNVGASSVALFKENGYKVAAVARTIRDEVKAHSDLVMTADFSDPGCLKGVFEKVEKELGIPNVVVYNRELESSGLSLIEVRLVKGE
jgi:NAD(P)-dependent dehydrogenase (short-subunit alcohol dehydrogenase family)